MRALLFVLAGMLAFAANSFGGKWDITLQSATGVYPSCVELSGHGTEVTAGRWVY